MKEQLALGPRVPGTAAHERTGDWIVDHMKARTDTVIVQRWTHVTAHGDSLPLRNILARINPTTAERVLYLTHWDTRPVADSDPDPANRRFPIPGANDGASGVALLVALADALLKTPPTVGVDLLFVDGEDYGSFGDATHAAVDVLLGSQFFADHLPASDYRPLFGVLFDMIGDADLTIYKEGISVRAAPEVVERVWRQAAALGYEHYFIARQKYNVTDDHVPLIRKGLRVIDVLDFDYGPISVLTGRSSPNYHHTLQDDLTHVSARSLQTVGDVAFSLVTVSQR